MHQGKASDDMKVCEVEVHGFDEEFGIFVYSRFMFTRITKTLEQLVQLYFGVQEFDSSIFESKPRAVVFHA